MGKLKINMGYEKLTIELEKLFIDHYLIGCPHVYVLIYIYMRRHCSDCQAINISDLSNYFKITEADVLAALNHWKDVGLISLQGTDDINIAFLPVHEPVEKFESKEEPQIARIERRPQYTTQEIAFIIANDKDVANLMSVAEQKLGKMLSPTDMDTVYGYYHEELSLPLDVIEYLLHYCCEERGIRRRKYINAVAEDWSDNDIDDTEKALLYVEKFDKNYRSILTHLGVFSDHPSPAQKKYIKRWLDEWGFSIDLILHACDKASLSGAKKPFDYANKILKSWYEKGCKTIADAEESDAKFISDKSDKKPKTNRFANFQQDAADYSDIEEMERAYRQRAIEEMERSRRVLEAV